MIRFALSLLVAIVTAAAGASLLWPKFMKTPMPPALSNLHDFVIQTPVGGELASVLGVPSDSITALDMKDVAASAASSIVAGVEQKTTEIFIGQLLLQLNRQIEKLPSGEQDNIRALMCKPSAP